MDIFSRIEENRVVTQEMSEPAYKLRDGTFVVSRPLPIEGEIDESHLPQQQGVEFEGRGVFARIRAARLHDEILSLTEMPKYAKKGINFSYWRNYEKEEIIEKASLEQLRILQTLGFNIEGVWGFCDCPYNNTYNISPFIPNLGQKNYWELPFFFFLTEKQLVHCLLTDREVIISQDGLRSALRTLMGNPAQTIKQALANTEYLFLHGKLSLAQEDIAVISSVCDARDIEMPKTFNDLLKIGIDSLEKETTKQEKTTQKTTRQDLSQAEQEIDRLFEEVENTI